MKNKNYILLILVLFGVNISFGIVNLVVFGKFWKDGNAYPSLLLVINCISIFSFFVTHLYRFNANIQLNQIFFKVVEFCFILLFFELFYWFSINAPQYKKESILLFHVINFSLLFILLKVYVNFLRKNTSEIECTNCLLIGNSQTANYLFRKSKDIKWLNLDFVQQINNIENYQSMHELIHVQKIKNIFIDTDIMSIDNQKEFILNKLYLTNTINIYGFSNLYLGKFSFVKSLYIEDIGCINLYEFPLEKHFNKTLKRIVDILVSILVSFFILSWLLPIVAIIIKLDSKGNVFYIQKRVGLYGSEFNIIKFRTMKQEAEKEVPELSSSSDNRITKAGKILRKYRIDEFPQFINTLKGDMSLVGPRPERKYFIDKITIQDSRYKSLLNIKPGITSLGQVHFGYAENVDEMVERMQYDLLYVKNFNWIMEIKIMIQTVAVMFYGKGK